MAEDLSGGQAGGSGQENSALNIGADLAAESIIPTERERAVFRALWQDTFLTIPEEGITWIIDRVVRQGIPVSVNQLQGFSQAAARAATRIATEETTGSTAYTNLSTVGPQLTGLPDGQYLVFWGAAMKTDLGGNPASMSVQANSASVDDDIACITDTSVFVSVAGSATFTLNSSGNNTLTAKYKTAAAGRTAFAKRRFLIAFKFANA